MSALRVLNRTALEREQELGRLDAIAGDGDHGQGMTLGSSGALAAATAAANADAGARSVLAVAGQQWAESAGGTSGALWGAGLTAFAAELSDTDAVTASALVRGVIAFRDTVGQTPYHYLLSQRLERARVLLREEQSMPVAEVARRCGFKNLSHVSATFRRMTGVSPKGYRG